MDKKPIISIIIPVFNAASYLPECLKSVVTQDFPLPYEIICVNDGSTDESLKILQSFSNNHSNLKIINQQNSGAAAARKKGVESSMGEWITFVDADDTLNNDALKVLYGDGRKDFDIIIAEIFKEGKPRIYDIEEFRINMIRGNITNYPFAKLFRRELFNESVWDIPKEIVMGEDMLMNVKLSFMAKKPVLYTGKIVYRYNRVSSSISHSFKRTPEYEALFHELLKRSLPEDYRNNEEFTNARIASKINAWNYMNLYNLSTQNNRESEFYKDLMKEVEESGYPLNFKERLQLRGYSFPLRTITIFLNILHLLNVRIKRISANFRG